MSRDKKIFKNSEKTAVHFFPECEKVNNSFTKIPLMEYFDSSEFSEPPDYSDELEFSSPKDSELSKFFEPSEYSHVSEYSVSIKFFGWKIFLTIKKFFTGSLHGRTSRRN